MPYEDLRQYLKVLEEKGLLCHVKAEVDKDWEISAVCRRTFRTILQNLGWAFGYNTAAIPLAVAGLLNPIIAGAAMAFSSVSVVVNSLRLARFRRRPLGHGVTYGRVDG